MGGTRKTVSI